VKIAIVLGFFNPCPPVRGGAVERMWHLLGREIAREGHEVDMISREWPDLPADECGGRLRHRRLRGYNHHRRLAINLALDAWWAVRVLPLLRGAEIVVSNSIFLPILLPWVWRDKVMVASLERQPKGQLRFYGGISRLQAPSRSVVAAVERQAPQLLPRTRLIPNATDLGTLGSVGGERFEKSIGWKPMPREAVTVGFVGRVHPEKGLELLIDAGLELLGRRDLPEWKIQILGPAAVEDGGGGSGYFERLRRDGARLMSAGRLEFLPPVFELDALAEAYRRMSIFCYPSRAEEGETFGVAVLEAMATGLPPVVSGLECFRDLVADGETGLIFDHRDEHPGQRLADQLERLVRDGEVRSRMGMNAARRAQAFDIPRIAGIYLDDFATLLGQD
jgi:glycosyltransferase involved in cell wall biosynthesis